MMTATTTAAGTLGAYHGAGVIIVTGSREDDVSGCCYLEDDDSGLFVATDCGAEVPVFADDIETGALRIIEGAAHDRYAALEEVWSTDPRYAADDADEPTD